MTQPRSIKLPPENWNTLTEMAKAEGLTINGYISKALGEHVKARGGKWIAMRQWGGKRIKAAG